jgi:ubiquinone/menaquinone biosynthesis C-methylase UbiE
MGQKRKRRWHVAQEQEEHWWKRGIASIDFEYLPRFAAELLDTVGGVCPIDRRTRILEIGSGPAGILTHLPSDFRTGVDPLEHFFAKVEECRRIRDRAVCYAAAQGEYLPFPDNSFDFIIMDNILDHCEDIELVMGEVRRVLGHGGALYLRNYTFTGWGYCLWGILEVFMIDRGHPYRFREKDLRYLFQRFGFEEMLVRRRGFGSFYKSLFASGKLSWIVRALTLSWADKVLFVLRNTK